MYITADILRSRLNSKAGQVLVLEELLSCPSLGWGMRMGLSQCKGFRWPSSITVWVTDTGPTALGISCFSLNNSTVTNSNQSHNYPCCFISTMSCIGTTADPVILQYQSYCGLNFTSRCTKTDRKQGFFRQVTQSSHQALGIPRSQIRLTSLVGESRQHDLDLSANRHIPPLLLLCALFVPGAHGAWK